VLPGAARRIACFATSAHSATPVVAYAESGGLDPKIHVHQVDTLELVTTLDGGAHLGITALAFSRDGRCIAVASAAPDPTLSLIETRTGEVLVTFGLRSEATTVAFDPFDSNRVLATHVSGGVLAVHPGVTLHVVDEIFHVRSVTQRPLLVDTAGVKPGALTAAAWTPSGTILLGTEFGQIFVVDPDDGSLIPPPGAVQSAVSQNLANETPQRPVAPPGVPYVWAFAGKAPVSSFAFSTARAAVTTATDGSVFFYSPFVAPADTGHLTKNNKLDTVLPARLVKTIPLGVTQGLLCDKKQFAGVARVAFSPSYDECVATTRSGAVFVLREFLDLRNGILAEEDGPSSSEQGMRTISEGEGDAVEPATPVGGTATATPSPFVSWVLGAPADADTADTAADATAASSDSAPASPVTASSPALSVSAEASKQDALRRIAHLRARLEDVIARNDAADEATKVPRGEVLMDETFKSLLVAEGETRVTQLRATLERENLVADFLASKIKTECWDTMETRGVAIAALNTPGLCVHRYPLPVSDRTARLGRRVAFLRRVELAEMEHFRDTEAASGHCETATARTDAANALRTDANAVFDLRVDAPHAGESKVGIKKGEETVEEAHVPGAYESILYDPTKLYPVWRKISQFLLLQMTTRETKTGFNDAFASMEMEKQTFVDKIAEINARVVDIRKELAGHTDDDTPLFECRLEQMEQEEYVLRVKDSELTEERWLSPEERALAETAAAAERERVLAKGENPPEDRALREMMGGRLEKAETEGVPDELPKPEWMIEIDKEDWNDEQRKQGREFENKAKTYKEELARRRVLLAAELVKLHEESSETVFKFDNDVLKQFLVKKLAVDSKLSLMEQGIVALAFAVETGLRDDAVEETRLVVALADAIATSVATQKEVKTFQRDLDLCRKKRDTCDVANQKLDREFKRDFAETDDLFDALFALYKRRKGDAAGKKHGGLKRSASGTGSFQSSVSSGGVSPARSTTPAMRVPSPGGSVERGYASPATEVPSAALAHVTEHDPFRFASGRRAGADFGAPQLPIPDPLVVFVDRPEGVDDAWWFKLVDARERKMQKEDEFKVVDDQISEMNRLMRKLSDADLTASASVQSIEQQIEKHARKRKNALYDLSLPTKMIQTYVEALAPEFELGSVADLKAQAAAKADAVLIDRSVVTHLNEVIQKHGAGKVETLIAIKDFKKGIYDLQWEKERLAMEGEDASHKIREIQMARAPVGLFPDVLVDVDLVKPPGGGAKKQTDASAGSKETDTAAQRRRNELASLEARLEHAKALHLKRVAEKRSLFEKTERKTNAIAEKNLLIAEQAREMDAATRDVASLRDSSAGTGGELDNAREAKARKMRALVTQSKLQHIAKAQAEEVKALRVELERARLRTFPSFVERADGGARLPEIKGRR
jgi:hypothetical protein